MKTLKLSSIIIIMALITPVLAQDTPQNITKGIVAEKSGLIRQIVLSSKSDDEMRERVKAVMESFVDFREFGRICLGDHWNKLTAAQQELYLTEFKKLLQRTYLRRFKAGRDFTVTYRAEPRLNNTGDRVEVQTTITSGDITADVDYRFYQVNGKWLVFDIIIDEVSVARNYRKSFVSVMDKDGFDVLIQKMKKKSGDAGESDDL